MDDFGVKIGILVRKNRFLFKGAVVAPQMDPTVNISLNRPNRVY